jgi:hypothetical protein
MDKYLHCIDLSDKLKCLNLCSTGTISSLLTVQLFINDPKPNPMTIDIDKLKNCTLEEIDGLSSPRMFFVYQRTILNYYTRPLTIEEKKFSHIGDLEIDFERARREFNSAAPSRLSCLYLVEDNFDGRIVLNDMFSASFKKPMILEVYLLNKMELMQFDHNWIDQYYQDPQERYLKSYWTSVMFNDEKPSWEYLLEGTIRMTNASQKQEIDEFVKKNYPDDYNAIIQARNNIS